MCGLCTNATSPPSLTAHTPCGFCRALKTAPQRNGLMCTCDGAFPTSTTTPAVDAVRLFTTLILCPRSACRPPPCACVHEHTHERGKKNKNTIYTFSSIAELHRPAHSPKSWQRSR